MTEMVTTASPSTPTDIPVSSTPAPSAPVEERTFRQSEVNDLVGRAKAEAIERYKRESSLASHQQPQQSYQPQQQVGMQQQPVSEEMIRRTAAEEAQRLRDQWMFEAQQTAQEQEAHKIAQEFFGKLETGKGKYEDYDKVIANVNLGNIPHIVQLSNMMDNTADVMYELAKNPGKIGNLHQLINIDPQLALKEMQRLSQSIKENAQAANFKAPHEPLSQLRPSNQGTGENGALTVADYKKKYRV